MIFMMARHRITRRASRKPEPPKSSHPYLNEADAALFQQANIMYRQLHSTGRYAAAIADPSTNTPLHSAALYGDVDLSLIKSYLAEGGDIYATDSLGRTPLQAARACLPLFKLRARTESDVETQKVLDAQTTRIEAMIPLLEALEYQHSLAYKMAQATTQLTQTASELALTGGALILRLPAVGVATYEGTGFAISFACAQIAACCTGCVRSTRALVDAALAAQPTTAKSHTKPEKGTAATKPPTRPLEKTPPVSKKKSKRKPQAAAPASSAPRSQAVRAAAAAPDAAEIPAVLHPIHATPVSPAHSGPWEVVKTKSQRIAERRAERAALEAAEEAEALRRAELLASAAAEKAAKGKSSSSAGEDDTLSLSVPESEASADGDGSIDEDATAAPISAEPIRHLELWTFGQVYDRITPKDFRVIRNTIMRTLNMKGFTTYQAGTSNIFPLDAEDCDLLILGRPGHGESAEAVFEKFRTSSLFRDDARPSDNPYHMVPLAFKIDGRTIKVDITCKASDSLPEYLASQPLNISAVVRSRHQRTYGSPGIQRSIERNQLLLTDPADTSTQLESYVERVIIRNALGADKATPSDKFAHQHLMFILKHTYRFLNRGQKKRDTTISRIDGNISYMIGRLLWLEQERTHSGSRITTGIYHQLNAFKALDPDFCSQCTEIHLQVCWQNSLAATSRAFIVADTRASPAGEAALPFMAHFHTTEGEAGAEVAAAGGAVPP